MGIEIERKFLVCNDEWRLAADHGTRFRQGYLCVGPPVAIRVRVGGGRAILNIKKATQEISRSEFEYPIPESDAEVILDGLCQGVVIEKTRYKVPYAGLTWEVDVFAGANEGLVVAEVELGREDQVFEKPCWAGMEVSSDPRYLNSQLALRPFRSWRE